MNSHLSWLPNPPVASAADASAQGVRQARLTRPSARLDPRVHAWRADLADAALADRVVAPRYAEATEFGCRAPMTMMRAGPEGPAISALLYGERFAVLDIGDGWAWGWAIHDGYVGYVSADALGAPAVANWRVSAPTALIFVAPDIKATVTMVLPFNARLMAAAVDETFIALNDGGFVHVRHVAPLGEAARDPVTAAAGFLGAPYRWGGRTAAGVDCSGLTQAALLACGVACPRDSDQQLAGVGDAVDPAARRRGDLVFFPGHVGIMADHDRLLHANAFAMMTCVEPLADVVARLRARHSEPILGVRRIEFPGASEGSASTCSSIGQPL